MFCAQTTGVECPLFDYASVPSFAVASMDGGQTEDVCLMAPLMEGDMPYRLEKETRQTVLRLLTPANDECSHMVDEDGVPIDVMHV